ncbi:hypothetical protein AAFF_G00331610 [Aldrovandia affinis]|uniref:Uncharacterized protein n=1 Tax=Aldrovandia affinis TaxID=143900 RepID=A0AAD7WQM9_9TELE|nr:hypothetical protein AAFF_G00331610 [Aldrovandia affinis]
MLTVYLEGGNWSQQGAAFRNLGSSRTARTAAGVWGPRSGSGDVSERCSPLGINSPAAFRGCAALVEKRCVGAEFQDGEWRRSLFWSAGEA